MQLVDIAQTETKDWLDFSLLSMFAKCPKSYYFRALKGITQADESVALLNGKAYHEAKATFYTSLKAGAKHEEAKALAITALIKGMALIKNPDAKRNITNAIEIFNLYCEYWKNDPNETIDVEIGFAIDLIDFLYIGKIDRLCKSIFGLLVEETKTTQIIGNRWQLRGKPNLQIDGYVSAAYIQTGTMPYGATLDVIPITDKPGKKGTEPFRILTTRTEQDVESWLSNIQAWWKHISYCKSMNFFPANTEACIPLLGFTCGYNLLCSKYPNPFKLDTIELPGEYKVEFWSPLDELK